MLAVDRRIGVIEVAAQARVDADEVPPGQNHRPVPAAGDGKPPAVSSIEALQYHEIGVERGVAAGIVGLGHQVRVEQGENDGALIALFSSPKALEQVATARHEAAPSVSFRK